MSKRIIRVEVTVDWENYDDVCDELLLEDTGIFDNLKDGVNIEILKQPENNTEQHFEQNILNFIQKGI
jgi:hypothetical protein